MLLGISALLLGIGGTYAAVLVLAAEQRPPAQQYGLLSALLVVVISAFYVSVQNIARDKALLDSIVRAFICG